MALYKYTAYNENGTQVTGEIEAESSEMASELIAQKGYIPETVKKKSGTGSNGQSFINKLEERLTPVKPREIILFTKQFRTMIMAGVAMIQILQIMEAQTENKKLKTVIHQMEDDIKEGASLTKAFYRHESVFSSLYCAMIRAGEMSGSLPEVLDRLIYIIEHENKVKSDIRAALRYPAIVAAMLAGAFFFLLTFIIPKFIKIFERVGLDLPIPTKICMVMYQMIHEYWAFMGIGFILSIITLIQLLRTKSTRYYMDRFFMRIPLFGPMMVKAAMSRFASIFTILQASGMTVLESMDILADTIGNLAITREFSKIKELLTEGRGISKPLGAAKYFTPMVVNMVAIGEESGNLEDMLFEVAKHYDSEVEYATKTLADSIGPILTLGLASVIGFFAFAIFLPMWDLTKMVN